MMTPFDEGWRDGTEDIHSGWNPRPDSGYDHNDRAEYMDGYREARRGWDNT